MSRAGPWSRCIILDDARVALVSLFCNFFVCGWTGSNQSESLSLKVVFSVAWLYLQITDVVTLHTLFKRLHVELTSRTLISGEFFIWALPFAFFFYCFRYYSYESFFIALLLIIWNLQLFWNITEIIIWLFEALATEMLFIITKKCRDRESLWLLSWVYRLVCNYKCSCWLLLGSGCLWRCSC